MGFAAKPSFRISTQTLDYAKALAICTDTDYHHRNYSGANISDSAPGRSHYWLYEGNETNPLLNLRMNCVRLKMYNTYIHTWWEDGTYQSINWDSAITRDALNAFGPVRVWKDSRCLYRDRHRFGRRNNDYPYGNGIVVDPDGWIHGLVDFKDVLRPGARAERTAIRNQLRLNATSRILLGEFGDVFAALRQDVKKGFGRWESGWMAQIPPAYSNIARLLYEEADNSVIMERIRQYRSWHDGPCRPTKDLAMKAAIETMATQLLSLQEWHVKQPVPYGNINVREL